MRPELNPSVAGERKGEFYVIAGLRPALAIEPLVCVLIGTPKNEFPQQLIESVKQSIPAACLVCVDTAEQLRATAKERQPQIIVADDRILGPASLADSIAGLAAVAPVLLVAAHDRQAEIERMIVCGQAEFVPRAADWESHAASLIELRLQSIGTYGKSAESGTSGPNDDMGEILRHEINNPLTGILGNAELLLAHSEQFPPAETQRIRTVVELAVRLRETVRRVSDQWRKRAIRESKCDLADPTN